MVGVRLKKLDAVRYFDPGDLEVAPRELVVVQTEEGLETGWVVVTPDQVVYSEVKAPLGTVVRKAGPEDLEDGSPLASGEGIKE